MLAQLENTEKQWSDIIVIVTLDISDISKNNLMELVFLLWMLVTILPRMDFFDEETEARP